MDLNQRVEDGRSHTEKELEEVKEMLRSYESEGEERRKEQEERYDKKMENIREDIKTWTEVGELPTFIVMSVSGSSSTADIRHGAKN